MGSRQAGPAGTERARAADLRRRRRHDAAVRIALVAVGRREGTASALGPGRCGLPASLGLSTGAVHGRPERTAAGASTNPIDGFIATRLADAGLRPAPAASRETFIRRAALTLTGLPPTPDDIDAFLADGSPTAFERVVDRYLASPAYGERMAMDWLDLARYADTYGYQADVERDMSPYRDWVIRAFNSNLSYDQFLTWQLAGDLLPGATRDQRIATAFNRLHRQTNEGGSVEEEFRTEYVADRVNTFGTAMLGLTLECARCHDHKFDPITQRDYFSLFAFFNNIDESGLYSHFTNATPTPALLLWPAGRIEPRDRIAARIAETERHLKALARSARGPVPAMDRGRAATAHAGADRTPGVRCHRHRHQDQAPTRHQIGSPRNRPSCRTVRSSCGNPPRARQVRCASAATTAWCILGHGSSAHRSLLDCDSADADRASAARGRAASVASLD